MEADWRGSQLELSARDLVAWQKAEQQIESVRGGSLIVRVVDIHGKPLLGVPVHYEQRSHRLGVGVQYPYHARCYDLFQEAGVNAATLWLGWSHVQPEPGRFNWGYLDRVWNPEELARRGLRLTAHALNWFKPEWHVLPDYVKNTPSGDLPALVYAHCGKLAERWGHLIDVFEIVNEPFWAEAQAIEMSLEDMVRICHAAALAIGDHAPNARLQVSFAEASRTRSYAVHPRDLLDALDMAEVRYDIVGLHTFENGYTAITPPTYYRAKSFTGILQTMSQYVRPGKTVSISALAVPSAPPTGKAPSRFTPPYGPWDEERQAQYLDAALTFFAGRAEIESITWWCPVDGRLSLIQDGGLLREDLSVKPSLATLGSWMARHTTRGQVYTDDQGRAPISGLAGDYCITVGTGARGKVVELTVIAQTVDDETIVLDYVP